VPLLTEPLKIKKYGSQSTKAVLAKPLKIHKYGSQSTKTGKQKITLRGTFGTERPNPTNQHNPISVKTTKLRFGDTYMKSIKSHNQQTLKENSE
jgi:hypothetical protein